MNAILSSLVSRKNLKKPDTNNIFSLLFQDSGDGKFSWLNVKPPYNCAIASPKKESKLKGLKSFIAYQLTPSVRIQKYQCSKSRKMCIKIRVLFSFLERQYIIKISLKLFYLKIFINFQFNNIQVSRRYKHFDWLHERLVEKYTFVPIPPLPDKQIQGMIKIFFIQNFLKRN